MDAVLMTGLILGLLGLAFICWYLAWRRWIAREGRQTTLPSFGAGSSQVLDSVVAVALPASIYPSRLRPYAQN